MLTVNPVCRCSIWLHFELFLILNDLDFKSTMFLLPEKKPVNIWATSLGCPEIILWVYCYMRTIKLKYCVVKVMQLIFSMWHNQFLYRSWSRDNLRAWNMMEALWNLFKRNQLKGKVKEECCSNKDWFLGVHSSPGWLNKTWKLSRTGYPGLTFPEQPFHQKAFTGLNVNYKNKRQLLKVVFLRMLRLYCGRLAVPLEVWLEWISCRTVKFHLLSDSYSVLLWLLEPTKAVVFLIAHRGAWECNLSPFVKCLRFMGTPEFMDTVAL